MSEPFKIFFDTEFLAHGTEADFSNNQRFGTEAVSIGLVTQNGTRLYVVFNDFDERYSTPWTTEHVLAKLPPIEERKSSKEIKNIIGEWLTSTVRRETDAHEIEFWHKEVEHDRLILRQTFGKPENFPRFLSFIGFSKFSFRDTNEIRRATPLFQPREQPEVTRHISIEDAAWEKIEYEDRINFLRYNPDLRRFFSAPELIPTPF